MSTHDDKDVVTMKVVDLNPYSHRVYTPLSRSCQWQIPVCFLEEMSTHRVAESLVADDTGNIYMTLWDDIVDAIQDDQVLNIKNAYVNLFRGSICLNLGLYGSYSVMEEAPLEKVNLDNNLLRRIFEQKRGFNRGRDRHGRQRRRY